MLQIICQNSMRYKEAISSICAKLNFSEYQILDPKTHNLDKSFFCVIVLGSLPPNIKLNASKMWTTFLPDQNLDVADKKEIMSTFKQAVEFVVNNKLKKEIKAEDVPRLADLKQFLDNYKGNVIEIKMPNGRFLGIYPDNDKLQGEYDLEYHASVVLNLARLQDVFGFTKLIIKEL